MTIAQAAAEKQWLSRKEAALYMSAQGFEISYRTLENWACNGSAGGGPPFYRLGWSRVRYKKDEIDSWLRRKMERVT